MKLSYITITGTVGDTKVDLELGIPVGSIAKQLPGAIKALVKAAPEIIETINKAKGELETIVDKLSD